MNYLPPPSTLPPGAMVDTYRRDSGGSKQDQSTGQQLSEIEAWCKKHDLILRHNFVDEAKSGGSTIGRDDFNRMVDLYRRQDQRPQGLILWNYARFARDLDNAIYYKALIRTYGIVIHSLNDNIPEGDYGRIIEFFIDMSNEEKKRQAGYESKRGLRDLVLNHGCVPGTPPVGFMRVPVELPKRRDGEEHVAHRWEPDSEIMPRIKQAFDMRAVRATLRTIHKATRLYNSISSYKSFFTNRLYIGILEFGDLVVENYCAPIVDLDTWNMVQEIVAGYAQDRKSDRHPRRANSVYLLSGLVYCGQCGAPMYGNTVTRKSRDEAYRCSRSRRTDQCNAGRISRRKVEQAVFDTLREHVLIPENLRAVHELVSEAMESFELGRGDRRTVLGSQRAKVSKKIANLTKAIADRGALPPLLDALTELNAQRAQINVELKELSTPVPPLPLLSAEMVVTVSQNMINLLETSPPEQVKTILQGMIQEIHVERKEKEIYGTVTYWYPFPFDHAPRDDVLSLGRVPLGALPYRQTFTVPFFVKAKAMR